MVVAHRSDVTLIADRSSALRLQNMQPNHCTFFVLCYAACERLVIFLWQAVQRTVEYA